VEGGAGEVSCPPAILLHASLEFHSGHVKHICLEVPTGWTMDG